MKYKNYLCIIILKNKIMLKIEEFKKRYEKELEGLSDVEIKSYYMTYLEDPFQFHPTMIG